LALKVSFRSTKNEKSVTPECTTQCKWRLSELRSKVKPIKPVPQTQIKRPDAKLKVKETPRRSSKAPRRSDHPLRRGSGGQDGLEAFAALERVAYI